MQVALAVRRTRSRYRPSESRTQESGGAGGRREAQPGAVLRVDLPRGGVRGAVARRGADVAARGADRGGGAARVRRVQAPPAARARRRAAQPPRLQPAGQPRQRRRKHAARRRAGNEHHLIRFRHHFLSNMYVKYFRRG